MIEYQINNEEFLKAMGCKNLDLPIRWDGADFRETLRSHFDNYHNEIASALPTEIIRQIKDNVSDIILSSIDKYFIGSPHQAYEEIDKVLAILMDKPLKIYPKTQYEGFPSNTDSLKLFRIRHVDSDIKYRRKDLFHTPFNLRSGIGSCRYSISGYPSLYLSTNLHLCCQETKKNNQKQLTIASRFAIVRNEIDNGQIPIKVVELAIKPSDFILNHNKTHSIAYEQNRYNKRLLNEIELEDQVVRYNYLFWYPIIAASSFIKANKGALFNPEYIIPQLLMQWIRVNSKPSNLFGIRYFSCASTKCSEMGFNYVFPVYSTQSQSKSGYCKILRPVFHLTSPVFLHEYADIAECEAHLIMDEDLSTIDVN